MDLYYDPVHLINYVETTPKEECRIDKLITIYYAEKEPHHRFWGEYHDFWELMYLDRGDLLFRTPNGEELLSAGQMVLYPPNYVHAHRSLEAEQAKPANMMVITFRCEAPQLHQLTLKPINLNKMQIGFLDQIVTEARAAFAHSLRFWVRCQLVPRKDQKFGAEQTIKNYLELLLISLVRSKMPAQPALQSSVQTVTDDQRTNEIIGLMRQRVHEKLTLEIISRHVSLSPSSVKSLFLRTTGTTCMRYFSQLKLEEAKYLLRTGKLSVSEVAEQLSYSSVQHFSKAFLQHTGYTPTQYMKSIKPRLEFPPEEE